MKKNICWCHILLHQAFSSSPLLIMFWLMCMDEISLYISSSSIVFFLWWFCKTSHHRQRWLCGLWAVVSLINTPTSFGIHITSCSCPVALLLTASPQKRWTRPELPYSVAAGFILRENAHQGKWQHNEVMNWLDFKLGCCKIWHCVVPPCIPSNHQATNCILSACSNILSNRCSKMW